MNISTLKQGQLIDAIWGPADSEGDHSGGSVGFCGVAKIEIGQCAGPMGWYDVAIIRYEDAKPDEIMPVHMAEYVRLQPDTAA